MTTPDLRALTPFSGLSADELDKKLKWQVDEALRQHHTGTADVIDEARRRLRELAQTERSPILPAGVLADIARQAAPYAHLRVGQVWQEMDSRFKRNVTILAIEGDRVRIRGDRTTTANIKRFRNPNGVSGGYMLTPLSPEATA